MECANDCWQQGHVATAEDISLSSIYRAARETGFIEVRRLLRQTFVFTADGPQWKDRILVERLFELNEVLLARLQAGEGLTPQLTLEAQALQKAVGAPITPLKKSLPFVYRWQRALFGQWQEIEDSDGSLPSLRLWPGRPQGEATSDQKVPRPQDQGMAPGPGLSLLLPQPELPLQNLHRLSRRTCASTRSGRWR